MFNKLVFVLLFLPIMCAAEDKVPLSREQVFANVEAQCNKGSAKDCYGAGSHYILQAKRKNPVDEKQVNAGKALLAKGCELGLATACGYAARIALVQKNRKEAREWFLKECKNDNKMMSKKGCSWAVWLDECEKGNIASCKIIDGKTFL